MPNLSISIPHQLGRAEARRRIENHVGEFKRQHGASLGYLQERWAGDTMTFSLTAMGQTITGDVTVEEQYVRVEVPLPWFLAALAGGVKQMIEQQGQKLLAGPKPA